MFDDSLMPCGLVVGFNIVDTETSFLGFAFLFSYALVVDISRFYSLIVVFCDHNVRSGTLVALHRARFSFCLYLYDYMYLDPVLEKPFLILIFISCIIYLIRMLTPSFLVFLYILLQTLSPLPIGIFSHCIYIVTLSLILDFPSLLSLIIAFCYPSFHVFAYRTYNPCLSFLYVSRRLQ
ncbi:hypothetical protein EV361DRAFT_565090 [Lentinula raphanica]|nr:hypothetical protein F5880DRAFT_770095 [Lentinula raphanica]KAJ3966489.1 hypothetical protein EV361DRAFT_565090 [Lentinula raphanica]